MGTHSMIIMRVKKRDEFVTYCKLYQQYDGYPSGVGMQLLNFLNKITLVNGFVSSSTNAANGASCLFAQIVSIFKSGVGGAYIVDPNSTDLEYYNYYVDVDDSTNEILFRINDIFSGTCLAAVDFIKASDL